MDKYPDQTRTRSRAASRSLPDRLARKRLWSCRASGK